jgi:hypothetical protein
MTKKITKKQILKKTKTAIINCIKKAKSIEEIETILISTGIAIVFVKSIIKTEKENGKENL